ncbi:SOCS box domain-containing protein [Caenorhabditis elegans]|uniref:SOCS box domain-containing protein n=1 Tax=Caenorhabditis elegans TaxID=6239 RepID=Q9GYM5_CAEEL|nr:SOCS box domain-containing protein [Caenorhabditis elegans]CCD69430.2 SOCS box domain-containing protein [Caenorhabditis elegans]
MMESHDDFESQSQLQRALADKITNYAPIEEIRYILLRGAQVDGQVTAGLTPLHYACYINYQAAAKLLLNLGAKVQAVDNIGCSALHLCAEHGHYRMIKLLLQYMKVVEQYETPEFRAGDKYPQRENVDEPLRLAIKNGHYDCARLLLTNGANANAIYFDGPEITQVSPLDTNFLELLLEFGADPNVFDRKGLTPIMKACRLRDKGIEAIRILLKYGADINKLCPERQDFRSALHFALLSGNHDLVKFMIANGSNVNMDEKYEKPSPIDIAVLKDDPHLLKIVLDAGANPNAVHTYIGSCLHLASCSSLLNQYQIVELLLEHGADMNLQHQFPDGSRLKSPFVEYFRSNDSIDAKVVKLFITHGAKVVMRNPLHDCRGQLRNVLKLAALQNQPEVLELLLGLGEQYDNKAIERLPLPTQLKTDISERAKNPHSLQHLCRIQIRDTVQTSEYKTLPIPEYLKAYLLGLIP